MSVLDRAWALHRNVHERAAPRVERFEAGAALVTEELPLVWDCNLVRVDHPERVTADEVVALGNRFHGGLRHRKVVLPHDGGELAAELGARGWEVPPLVVMRWAGDPDPQPAGSAELVDPRAVRAARADGVTDPDPELRRQVAAWGERVAAATGARVFAVFDGGSVAAFCVLLEHDGTAEIDDVTTVAAFRGRGHATAVVQAAVAASLRAGNDLTFLVAAGDEWPRHWYARLGFADAGPRFEAVRSF